MYKLISVLISFTFCAKQFYELNHEYVFLSVVSFLGFWSSKVFSWQQMSLPAQNRVWSTSVHSTQALVIVRRKSNRKLPHLTVVRALAHYLLMKNLTTLWHLFTIWVPRCQNSHLFYTITTLDRIWSLPPFRLNWIRFKGS